MLNNLTSDKIIRAAALVHGTNKAEILGSERKANIVRARRLAWYFEYYNKKLSLNQIGRKYNRDNSTIYHGISQFAAKPAENCKIDEFLNFMEKMNEN